MTAQLQPLPTDRHVRVELDEGYCDVCGSFSCAGLVLTDDSSLVLDVHICDQRRGYYAEFASEQQVIDFIQRNMDLNHAFFEVQEASIPTDCPRLLEVLYPTCEHGLSEDLCWGPTHYPTADQERERGW